MRKITIGEVVALVLIMITGVVTLSAFQSLLPTVFDALPTIISPTEIILALSVILILLAVVGAIVYIIE